MARKRRTAAERAEAKRKRALTPRGERRPKSTADPEDRTWLNRSKHRMIAVAILNRENERPYWGSIPKTGPAPVSGYFPCSFFETASRIYYGFLIREHRDEWVQLTDKARKELTEVAAAMNRSVRK